MATGKATISAVQAATKILYPNGEAEVINKNYKRYNRIKKATDFGGESAYVAIKNANPQGVGVTVSQAQSSLAPSSHNRFNLTRVKRYGIVRVDGEAIEAVKKTRGGLVDLWANETQGVAQTMHHDNGVHIYGNGSGVLGRLLTSSSGTGTATISLGSDTNMNNFELFMFVNAVSDTTLSPTVRAGTATQITGIDRKNKTLTAAANWTSTLTGIVDGDYLVRAGDQAAGGTAKCITGMDAYIAGGSSPGTLFSLNRNSDPVRLAGQTADYTSQAIEDAVLDADSLRAFQGSEDDTVCYMNPIRVAKLKQSMNGKVIFNNSGGGSKSGTLGFSKVYVEGESGNIEIVSDPYCPLSSAYLGTESAFTLWSLGAAPNLANFDTLDCVRLTDEDTYEARWRMYGQTKCEEPGAWIRLTGVGQ